MDEPPRRVDFLTKIEGLTYAEADAKKVFLPLGEFQVPVLHLDHLIANKMISCRAKDNEAEEVGSKVYVAD